VQAFEQSFQRFNTTCGGADANDGNDFGSMDNLWAGNRPIEFQQISTERSPAKIDTAQRWTETFLTAVNAPVIRHALSITKRQSKSDRGSMS
jgi:hypothetical protein